MSYNKNAWKTGDIITKEKLNNMENGIYEAHDEIETLKNNTSSGTGITPEQAQQLSTAYQHSQSTHAPSNAEANVQVDWNVTDTTSDAYIKNKPTNLATTDQIPTVPTKTSELTNDSDYVNSTYVTNKIAEAALSGGDVDLSGYVTKETGNANQITFADGQTFQAKLEAGTLKGDKGDHGEQGPQGPAGANGADGLTTAISVNGSTYTQVDGIITLPNYSTGTGSGTGSNIISNMKYYVTPEMFGAKGDGVTNDFLAFQTAFDNGYNVICEKGKVYNLIGGIVKLDGNTNRILDLNGSTLIDACFAYNLKEDFSDWDFAYCPNSFTIKNGNIGSLSKAREHSKECVFLTGGFLILKDLCVQRTPHLVAHIDRFIDQFIMENVTNHAWADKAEDFKGLDCVNVLDRATGQIVKSSHSKYSQGDGWLFTKVNEFHSDFDENYNLVTCNFHQSIKFSMCIQSAISIGCRNIAIIEGCHFESTNCKISFSTDYLNDSNILIKGCAFIDNYEILDHICVTYQNCKFHLGYEIQKKWSQFFSKRLIEYACKFIRCSTNELGFIDNYANYVLWNTPIICNQSGWWLDELNKINCSFFEHSLYKGSLDPLGEYNITMYLHLSNDLSQAYMKKEFTINKTAQSSALSISTFPLDGGILEIYVTNPNGETRVGWIRIPNIHNSTQLGSNSYRYNQIVIMNDMITLKNQNPYDIVYDTMTVVDSIPDRVISSVISK